MKKKLLVAASVTLAGVLAYGYIKKKIVEDLETCENDCVEFLEDEYLEL